MHVERGNKMAARYNTKRTVEKSAVEGMSKSLFLACKILSKIGFASIYFQHFSDCFRLTHMSFKKSCLFLFIYSAQPCIISHIKLPYALMSAVSVSNCGWNINISL